MIFCKHTFQARCCFRFVNCVASWLHAWKIGNELTCSSALAGYGKKERTSLKKTVIQVKLSSSLNFLVFIVGAS